MLNICLTGFDSKEKTTLAKFIEELGDIGFKLQIGITFAVSVLVCNAPTSDKYKVAQRLGIEIVTKEWVYKCYEKHIKVDFKQYKFKPFRNVKLALFGFLQSELDKLADFIIKNEGTIEIDIGIVDVVVFKKGTQYEFELKNCNKILVDSDWILLCLERQTFVPTQFFNYNQQRKEARELLQDLQCSKVVESLGKIEVNELTYLKNCVIFIAIKDENIKKVIAQLISVADGYFVNLLLPVVTHIVYLQGCSEEINQQFQHIVHPMWLFDSFNLKKKLREEEYYVKFKLNNEQQQSALNSFANSQEEQQRDQFLFGKIPETRPFMDDCNNQSKFGLKSQSFSNNNSNLLAFNRFSISTRKSKLFEQCQVYVFDHSTFDKSNLQLLTDNGALVERLSYPLKVRVSNLKINKSKQILIFLLPDHENVKETTQIVQRDCKAQSIKFFSYRWIQYCLEKNLLELQVVNKKLYHLQPTNQITPTTQLKDKLIYVQSNNVDLKIVFKNLAKIVTGITPQFEIADLDYFVTDKMAKKYQQVIDVNKNARIMNQIKIKDFDWLLQQYVRQNTQI